MEREGGFLLLSGSTETAIAQLAEFDFFADIGLDLKKAAAEIDPKVINKVTVQVNLHSLLYQLRGGQTSLNENGGLGNAIRICNLPTDGNKEYGLLGVIQGIGTDDERTALVNGFLDQVLPRGTNGKDREKLCLHEGEYYRFFPTRFGDRVIVAVSRDNLWLDLAVRKDHLTVVLENS